MEDGAAVPFAQFLAAEPADASSVKSGPRRSQSRCGAKASRSMRFPETSSATSPDVMRSCGPAKAASDGKPTIWASRSPTTPSSGA